MIRTSIYLHFCKVNNFYSPSVSLLVILSHIGIAYEVKKKKNPCDITDRTFIFLKREWVNLQCLL